MTGWIIAGSLPALAALVLLAPVRLHLRWRGNEVRCHLWLLMLRFRVWPLREAEKAGKKSAKRIKKEERAEERAEEGPAKKERAWPDTLGMVWEILKRSQRPMAFLCRRIVFYRIRGRITVAAGDAHQAAVRYGLVMTAASVAADVVQNLFTLRRPRLSILPDFVHETGQVDISLGIKLRPVYALAALLWAGARLLPTLLAGRKKKPGKRKRQTIKGGNQHEPRTSH